MAIPGVYASDASTPGDRDCDPIAVTMLETGQMDLAPLFSLTAGMGRETVTQSIVSWVDMFPLDYTSIVTGVCNNPKGSVIEISNPGMVQAKDVLYVAETGEILFVVGCDECNITVKRGFACTPCCPILENYHLERISSAFEEGSDPPTGFTHNHGESHNCTMIIRSSFEITGTAVATRYKSGDKRAMMLREITTRHAQDKECAMLFSRKYSGQIGGRPWRMMDGLDAMIKQNRFVCPPSGADRLLWDAFMQRVNAHQIKGMPHERIYFGSGITVTAINEMAWSMSVRNINFANPSRNSMGAFGIKFTEYSSPYGDLKIFRHPKLEGRAWGQRLYAIHPGAIKMYHMRDRMNILQDEGPSQSGNGSSRGKRDSQCVVLTSEFSMAYMQQSTAAVMTHIKPCYWRG